MPIALAMIAGSVVTRASAQTAETIVIVDNRPTATNADPGDRRARVVAALAVYPTFLPVVSSEGGIVPSPQAVAALLEKNNGSFAIILDDADIAVWTRRGAMLGVTDDPETVPDVIRGAGRFARRGIDPTQPLLREDGVTRPKPVVERSSHRKWWVYAIVAGAVGLTGAIFISDVWQSDKQRVEIELP
jgi:hypothetical protein